MWQLWAQLWHPAHAPWVTSLSLSSDAHNCPSLGRRACRHSGPSAGAGVSHTDQGCSRFSGCILRLPGEAGAGEGSAQIYPPIPPAPSPGAPSYLPGPASGKGRGGVLAGAAGAGRRLGTGRRAGPAAASPTRWVTAAEGSERPCRLWPAARPSPAPCRTARAPRPVSGSAIFTHRGSGCRAKASGHRGHRAPTGCRQLWGWCPFLRA